MEFYEKLIELRKQKGWSQEELAFKLNVSRQSVSKWEMGLSTPELDKIISLSEIFNVSLDYLVKDSLSSSDKLITKNDDFITLSDKQANDYLKSISKNIYKLALGVFLLILSPTLLIFLTSYQDYKPNSISDNLAVGIGVIVLVLLVAIAVPILINYHFSLKEYNALDNKIIKISKESKQNILTQKKIFYPKYTKGLSIGVVLCILSVLPLLTSLFFKESKSIDFLSSCLLLVTFILVASGVYIIIYYCNIYNSMNKLLQEEEYNIENKEDSDVSALSEIYWILITAAYLTWSFISTNWGDTWIIWPIAGIIYSALAVLVKTIKKNKNSKLN